MKTRESQSHISLTLCGLHGIQSGIEDETKGKKLFDRIKKKKLYVLKPSDINVIVILFANVSELDESVIILNETSLVCERNYYRKGK